MDKDLIMDIQLAIDKIKGCDFLPDEAGTKLVIEVAERFSLDTRQLFMWDTDVYSVLYDYGSEPDRWEPQLVGLLAKLEDWIYLVITAEPFFPWKVIHLKKVDCVALLRELPFFEYFIFDVSMLHIAFDTHHNAFVVFEKGVIGPGK